jgi:hypothetical protein
MTLFHDIPDVEADHWISLLKPNPAKAFMTPLTNEGWRYVPVTYLYCENDQAIPIAVQRSFVENCEVKVREVSCESAHSPFLNMPEKVVETVEEMLM